jgi:hypothetical protein
MTVGFIASTIPAKVLRVSDTTLFQIAMMETGDPLQWVAIAELNGLTDPWIFAQQTLLIPPLLPLGRQTGILESVRPGARPSDVPVGPLATTVVPATTGSPSLDFSVDTDSQYLPLIG